MADVIEAADDSIKRTFVISYRLDGLHVTIMCVCACACVFVTGCVSDCLCVCVPVCPCVGVSVFVSVCLIRGQLTHSMSRLSRHNFAVLSVAAAAC